EHLLASASPCIFPTLSTADATLLHSVMGLAERSRDNFPEEILIRFDLRTFLYHWFFEPLTGRRKSVFPSRTNQTGVECSRRVFLPMTVIRSSSEASSAF